MTDDAPLDPFLGDPSDPAAAFNDDDAPIPLLPSEREAVVADLRTLERFRALLQAQGIRGIVVDCEDCHEPHFFDWELIQSNLHQLLDQGKTRVHEPAYEPDPDRYVSWEYALGFADGASAFMPNR